MIKLGCCIPGESFISPNTDIKDESAYGVLKSGCDLLFGMGYDYCEVSVGMLMKLSDEEYERAKADKSIKIEAANCFIPGRFRIADLNDELREYARMAIERVAAFGGKHLVFGSGGARKYIENESPETAKEYILEFLRYCDKVAGEYGIIIVIEPLGRYECNILNRVAEGAEYVRILQAEGCKNIKLLCDSYHMSREGDSYTIGLGEEGEYNTECFEAVEKNADIIVHAHVSEPFDRGYPGSHDGKYVTTMFETLKKIDYNYGVTIECNFKDILTEGKTALEFLQSLR